MTPDQSALLAAVRGSPHDLTPRLVYADWLDEHPADRRTAELAAYVRAECDPLAAAPDGREWRAATFDLAQRSQRAGVTWAGGSSPRTWNGFAPRWTG